MCTSSFFGYPLISYILVIHYSGFFVMASSSHLANFLRSLVLESPVVGPNFLESFVHTNFASPYLLYFFFASSRILKQAVSSCAIISSF